MTRGPSGNGRILIVDPDPRERASSSAVLRRAGHSTVEAKNGEDAIEIAQRGQPSVIVLETCLPGISGYEVCRELREIFGEDLGIMFISGTRTEPHDRVAGLLLGADDYLVKPFAADELMARVSNLVRRSRLTEVVDESNLTPREREVVRLIAGGLDRKEIAMRLSISPRTVGTHMEHIYAKLGVCSRAQAVAVAYQAGLVTVTTSRHRRADTAV